MKAERSKKKEISYFTVKLWGFCFFSIRFEINYSKKIIPNYDLTNFRTKLCSFCISPAQDQNNNIKKKLSKKRYSNVIVLIFTAETERIQSLIRRLAQTDFKSI